MSSNQNQQKRRAEFDCLPTDVLFPFWFFFQQNYAENGNKSKSWRKKAYYWTYDAIMQYD